MVLDMMVPCSGGGTRGRILGMTVPCSGGRTRGRILGMMVPCSGGGTRGMTVPCSGGGTRGRILGMTVPCSGGGTRGMMVPCSGGGTRGRLKNVLGLFRLQQQSTPTVCMGRILCICIHLSTRYDDSIGATFLTVLPAWIVQWNTFTYVILDDRDLSILKICPHFGNSVIVSGIWEGGSVQ